MCTDFLSSCATQNKNAWGTQNQTEEQWPGARRSSACISAGQGGAKQGKGPIQYDKTETQRKGCKYTFMHSVDILCIHCTKAWNQNNVCNYCKHVVK